jgi:hypothetical protein
MNSGIEGNSYGAVISPTRITYKVGQGSSQVIGDALLIGTNDDEVNYGSTQRATDLILQMPMMYNNGVLISAGSLSLQIPDGTTKGGNARGIGAVDLQAIRSSNYQVASGNYSAILSGTNNTASGFSAVAGGANSNASGPYSVAVGSYASATSSYAIALGQGAAASGTSSLAFTYSTSSGGYSLGMGVASVASGTSSVTLGTRGTTNNITSKLVIGTEFNNNVGEYQSGILLVGASTVDATATAMKSRVQTLSETIQCTLQNNNAMTFKIEVVAHNTVTGMCGRWEAKGLIKRGANASSTALVGTPTVTLTNGDNEAWIVSGAIAITADTTYGALAVTATGAASTTIKWLAKIETTEVA